MSQIQLKTSSIKEVPLQSYEKDFTFIVNGDKFHTSKIESDLLSSKINQIHINDPTFNTFIVNTRTRGDFSNLFRLFNFSTLQISEDEIEFLIEVFEILGTEHISINNTKQLEELTIDNVFSQLKKHSKHNGFFKQEFETEIEFISSHMNEIIEKHDEELFNLDFQTIIDIIDNDHIRLKDEDQLLKFINELYKRDRSFSILYENVLFLNVSIESIDEFISIFNIDDISTNTWINLRERLRIECNEKQNKSGDRYIKVEKETKNEENKLNLNANKITIPFNGNNEFSGIISYLREKSNQNIENVINVTSSSIYENNQNFNPFKAVLFEETAKDFGSGNYENSWICIDFKEHRIKPTHYTVRSGKNYSNRPRSWVIECSNDNNRWEILDEENNNTIFNDFLISHTFQINKQDTNEYRYIRMRNTGYDSNGSSYFLFINSIEFYGELN